MGDKQWIKVYDTKGEPIYIDFATVQAVWVDNEGETVEYKIDVCDDNYWTIEKSSHDALCSWINETVLFDSAAYNSMPKRLKL